MNSCVEHPGCLGVDADPRHFGEEGNLYNPSESLRYAFNGIGALDEVGAAVEVVGAELCRLSDAGWEMDGPVLDGTVTMHWTKSGPPPIEHSSTDDEGMRAHERVQLLSLR